MNVGIFLPSKGITETNIQIGMKSYPGQKLLKDDFSALMRELFYEVFKTTNLVSAFEATYLFPLNPEKVFIKCRNWKEGPEMIEQRSMRSKGI
jgi:hypothetical protein